MRQGKLLLILLCLPILMTGAHPAAMVFIYTRLLLPRKSQDKLESNHEQDVALFSLSVFYRPGWPAAFVHSQGCP